jgi:hypothetical protein
MKPFRFAALALFLTAASYAHSQVASFSSLSNLLVVPQLQVDGKSTYTNVQLSLPANGVWSLVSYSNTTGNTSGTSTGSTETVPTLVISPASMAGLRGGKLIFTIAGGKPPYVARVTDQAILSSPSVAVDPSGASGVVEVSLYSVGSSTVNVVDSLGTLVSANVTGSSSLVISPSSMSGFSGGKLIFTIAGGMPPYVARVTDQAILSSPSVAVDPSGASGMVEVSLYSVGSSTVNVVDSLGTLVSANVTVNSTVEACTGAGTGCTGITPTLVISPTSMSGTRGGRLKFTIAGGKPPYVASVTDQAVLSNPSVEVDPSGLSGIVEVALYSAGSSTVNVVDSLGTIVSASVTVIKY